MAHGNGIPRPSKGRGIFFCPEVTMLVAELSAPGKIELVRRPRPVCPPGGALIRVLACGLCASDLKMWRAGHRELTYPRVLGHELAGVVEEWDGPAGQLAPGDLAQVPPGLGCGSCPACVRGRENRCPRVRVLGFSHDGGLAQWLALPAGAVASLGRVPSGLDAARASLAEPLACALNALDLAGLAAGDRVLVVGGGPLGRLTALAAGWLGAGAVAVAEKNPARLAGLDALGARALGPEELHAAAVHQALDGPPEVVVPACADPAALELGLAALAPGGRLVAFSGLHGGSASPPVDINRLHYLEQSLVGAYGCTAAQNRRALCLLADRTEAAAALITHRLPLEGIHAALALAASGRTLRVVLEP